MDSTGAGQARGERTGETGAAADGETGEAGEPGERELVARLRARLAAVGDDAAVVDAPAGGSLLLCADAVVAGIHVDLGLFGLDDLGWKALAACVSDVAAMGGEPRWALVTVSGAIDLAALDLVYDGLVAASEEYRCPVVGGDLTGGDGLVVSVSVVGSCDGPAVRRSGARAGDGLWLTGTLGASAAGLALARAGRAAEAPHLVAAHARPRARVVEGRAARLAGATAMIDISDGLATEVRHLASESGVGVALATVPVAAGVEVACADPLAAALGGGEDYELLFAAPGGAGVEAAFAAAGLRAPIPIGECTAVVGRLTLGSDPLPEGGWEHRW